jgi:hypothetical protein
VHPASSGDYDEYVGKRDIRLNVQKCEALINHPMWLLVPEQSIRTCIVGAHTKRKATLSIQPMPPFEGRRGIILLFQIQTLWGDGRFLITVNTPISVYYFNIRPAITRKNSS